MVYTLYDLSRFKAFSETWFSEPYCLSIESRNHEFLTNFPPLKSICIWLFQGLRERCLKFKKKREKLSALGEATENSRQKKKRQRIVLPHEKWAYMRQRRLLIFCYKMMNQILFYKGEKGEMEKVWVDTKKVRKGNKGKGGKKRNKGKRGKEGTSVNRRPFCNQIAGWWKNLGGELENEMALWGRHLDE